MKRLIALATALVAALLTLGAASAAAPGRITLTEAALSSFPNRAYVISLPKKARLGLGQLSVTENGEPVTSLQLAKPGAAGGSNFGVILMIDTSNSMRGAPIEGAIAAARTFAARRNPGQQLALMTFNSNVETVLPFTTDEGTIERAFAETPRLAEGTHIHDALNAAASLLRASQIPVGSVVILSDGQDVGSRATLESAIGSLQAAKARVFSVGLRSPQFDAATLEAVAAQTGGTYTEASGSNSLGRIYNALGYTLGNEYLLRYRSLAGPSAPVRVSVRIKGFDAPARASYTTPALPTAQTTAAKSLADRVIQSSKTLAVIVVALVSLIGLGVFSLLYRKERGLQRRLGEFVSLGVEEQARERRAEVKAQLKDGRAEAGRSGLWSKLLADLEFAQIETSPAMIAFLTAVGGLILGVVVAVLLKTPFGLLVAVVAPFVTNAIIQSRVKAVRRQFGDQLPENLDVLSSAMRAGHSFTSGLSVCADDAREPSKSEFQRVLADEQLGVPLDEALHITAKRMRNRDLVQVALIAQLQRDAGTNSAEVLDQVAVNVRGRLEIRRLIRTLTAQGRMARWIVSLLPVFLFWAIFVMNRDYMRPLWDTTIGVAMLCLATFMVVLGSYIIKRIVEIEV